MEVRSGKRDLLKDEYAGILTWSKKQVPFLVYRGR